MLSLAFRSLAAVDFYYLVCSGCTTDMILYFKRSKSHPSESTRCSGGNNSFRM